MLIARAPVRISFAGGGTDLPAYYEAHGGLVVSTTIDKYFYVLASLNGADSVQLTSSDFRTYFRQRRGQSTRQDDTLLLPRAFLQYFGIDAGLSLFLASEVPPGTGLGSSSAVAVALAKTLGAVCELNLSRRDVAEIAATVEIERLGFPIGRQDQYAAAYGGFNIFHFSRDGVEVEPLNCDVDVQRALEQRLLLFYTGAARSAASILKDQQAATAQHDAMVISALHRLKEMAQRTIEVLRAGELAEFGALLHDAWQLKKRLASGVTTARIDEWYELARSQGALGGKITGAGGGGFLLLYCPEAHQESVTTALEAAGLVRMDFHFERGGAVLLMDALPHVASLGNPVLATAGATARV